MVIRQIVANDEKGLTEKRISDFISLVKDDEKIECYINNDLFNMTTKERIIEDCFKYKFLYTIKNDDVFELKTDSISFLFNGETFLWWTKTNRRIEKLASYFTEKKIEKPIINTEKEFSVGLATLVDNELSNIHHFKGKKKDCIDFINKDMIERYIDGMMNVKVVINLAFDINEFNEAFSTDSVEKKNEYKKNLELWYTLEELEEIGAITLK